MSQAPLPSSIEFCDCVFDAAARRLARAGRLIALEPKMYDLLEILIERRPAIVTNEQLDELLWPNVYVARTSLTRLVSELRSLLGDSARDARIIRTVYKRGYSFCADATMTAVRVQSGIKLLWGERLLPLALGGNVLGRDVECDLVIDAATVSRRHARITLNGDAVQIEDLGSKNGTHVDGREIRTPTMLNHGSEISLGSSVMTLRMTEVAAPTVLGGPGKNRPIVTTS